MSIVVTLRAEAKRGCSNQVIGVLRSSIPETRAFDGCKSIEVYEDDKETGKFLLHQEWESKEKYKAYFIWRSESEAMKQLRPMLVATPEIQFYFRAKI